MDATTLSPVEAARLGDLVIDVVAERLGNTRAVCRKSYIHPAILDAYLDGTFAERWRAEAANVAEDLSADEAALLAWLREMRKG